MTVAPFTKSFATVVGDFAAAAQAESTTPLDFSEGSVFLALAEACAGNADWLQKLYLFALSVERLQTSLGSWVDTWVGDFGLTRLPADAATGLVTFGRNTPQAQAIVPVGALVSTFDGTQLFQVYEDITNPSFNLQIIPGGGYVLPAGVVSINVPVQAQTLGSAGNVLANTITRARSTVVGIDTISNPAPLISGLDQETDDQLKARFKLFILSLRAGTEGAIEYAVASLQQGLQCVIHSNFDPNGTSDPGSVTVFIDDGSGNPSTALVQLAAGAVNAIRAAGDRAQVVGATKINANVVMVITTAAGYDHPTLVAAAANAVGAYIDSLGLEVTLPFNRLSSVAFNASLGITNVSSVTLNGATADMVPGWGQTIKANSIVAS
jgi:phage-related baseplate assembly protein